MKDLENSQSQIFHSVFIQLYQCLISKDFLLKTTHTWTPTNVSYYSWVELENSHFYVRAELNHINDLPEGKVKVRRVLGEEHEMMQS